MCLVQVGNGLGVSCALNLADNMFIYTNNIRVKEAREAILEFLLSNHHLIVLYVIRLVSVIYKIFHEFLVLIKEDFMKIKKGLLIILVRMAL
jgi:hypothetical protein